MVCLLSLAVALVLGTATERPVALEHLDQALKSYLELRHDAAKGIPDLPKAASAQQIAARQQALAERIRAARPGAQPGDVLVSEARPILRQRLDAVLSQRPAAKQKEIATGNPAHDGGGPVPLKIGAGYPKDAPRSNVPTAVLAVLPRLPKELEYRFTGDHLLLLDAEADVIVDFMTNAADDPAKKGGAR